MSYKMVNARKDGFCIQLADAVVRCDYGYHCERCELADRIAKNTGRFVADLPLLGWRDALPQTPSYKGEVWFRKPVILSPEAMTRLGLPLSLRYQIILADDGPGVFKHNPCGEIDGVLYADLTREFTVTRSECFGMPNERACRLYDSHYSRHGVRRLVEFFDFPTSKPSVDFRKRRDGR